MHTLPKIAAAALVGLAAFAATPALAQGGYEAGYDQGWRGSHGHGPYGRFGYNNYDVDAGEVDIAICPPGYRLGRQGSLCWPE